MEVDNKPIRPQARAALSQLPGVVAQMRETANAIRRDAAALAPKRTGNLSRNIQVERVYDKATGRVEYAVGWGPKAWYGRLVEFGTEHSRPRPHLIPAAIKHGATAARGGDV